MTGGIEMVCVYGKTLNRKEMLRRVGSMESFASIRPHTYTEGKSNGVKAFEVNNGTGLEFTILESKCLDIVNMRYKGMPLHYAAKSGIVAPALADMHGTGFMRSISGGMVYTCGLQNVGTATEDHGLTHVFHGNLKDTPADQVAVSCRWEGDEYMLDLSGQMREATIFNENLVLQRTLSTSVGSRAVTIRDTVENQGFDMQELMLLYHINIGYPVLDEETTLLLPAVKTHPRDEAADVGRFGEATGPIDGAGEQVFKHEPAGDETGITGAAVVNRKLGVGVYVKYNIRQLPFLVQWKSMRSGDYALGMMPSTSFVKGRTFEREHGTLQPIGPFSKLHFALEIGVLDGVGQMDAFDRFIQSMSHKD